MELLQPIRPLAVGQPDIEEHQVKGIFAQRFFRGGQG